MPTRPRIQIPEHEIVGMRQQAGVEHPRECCGLLLGHATETAYQITQRLPLTNVLQREDQFESSPTEMLAAHRLMRQTGLALLAVYHSHPNSPPVPSQQDRDRSVDPSVACIIIGPGQVIAAWWLLDGQTHVPADWECVPQ